MASVLKIQISRTDDKFPQSLTRHDISPSLDFHQHEQKVIKSYSLLLKRLVLPHFSNQKQTILSLGAGSANDFKAYKTLLGTQFTYDAVDIDFEYELRGATEYHRDSKQIKFHTGDATSFTTTQPFSVVQLRHQNCFSNPQIWQKIVIHGLSCLAPDGVMLITSYTQAEAGLLLTQMALAKLKIEILTIQLRKEESVSSKDFYTTLSPAFYYDQHIIVLRKSQAYFPMLKELAISTCLEADFTGIDQKMRAYVANQLDALQLSCCQRFMKFFGF